MTKRISHLSNHNSQHIQGPVKPFRRHQSNLADRASLDSIPIVKAEFTPKTTKNTVCEVAGTALLSIMFASATYVTYCGLTERSSTIDDSSKSTMRLLAELVCAIMTPIAKILQH